MSVQNQPPTSALPPQQPWVVRLAFIINLISLGGFMMVVPLGPDLVKSIAMNPAHIGYLVGGSMLASGVSSYFLAGFVDRFDRKTIILALLTARACCLLLCAFAQTPMMLIALFSLSGIFTGPASAVLMASVIDVTPPQHRGKAMAFVGSAFSMAAIVMVPLSLQLALYFSWQMNFVLFAVLGFIITIVCWLYFPSMTGHLQGVEPKAQAKVVSNLWSRNAVKVALFAVGIQILAHFLIITNFSAYYQFNLDFPREYMSWLYLSGGVASFIALRYIGKLFDNGWRHQLHMLSAICLMVVLWLSFATTNAMTSSVIGIFVLFTVMMTFSTIRNSVTGALTSSLPKPPERAAFMSLNATVTSIASGGAGILSSFILTSNSENQLQGMSEVTLFSIVLTLIAPLALWRWVNSSQFLMASKPPQTQPQSQSQPQSQQETVNS